MSSWAIEKVNLKLFLAIAISVIVLGLIGTVQYVYAGAPPPSSGLIVWTGEGADNSFFNAENWRDAIFENHRLPFNFDVIYIDDRCDAPFLPDFQVDNAEVHMDFFGISYTLFGTIIICSDDTLVIDSGTELEIVSLTSLDNEGTLIIDGVLTNTASGVINNIGEIKNNNQLDNEGTINNNVDGLIINKGTIKNPGGLTINNFGTIINICDGEITGEQPIDQGDGITINRSCDGPLYSIDNSNPPILREIDSTNAQTISEIEISIAGFDPDDIMEGTGLATNPNTGELFGLLNLDSDDEDIQSARTLVTLVPETGSATIIGVQGNTGDAFVGIAFDSTGNLFGVTDDGADDDSSLFSLSTSDGSAMKLCEFGNGEDGESLAFNSDAEILYHASGVILETVDDFSVDPCTVTDVVLSEEPGEVTALTYSANDNLFFWASSEELNTVTANPGDVTFIDNMDHESKGLAFGPPSEEIPEDPSSTLESSGGGSTTSQDPNLGDRKHGTGHKDGFCMNIICITIHGFLNHFPETTVPQGSTQTFTILVNCPRGANTCNHIEIAGALPDSDFYEYQWAATLDRQPGTDNWVLSTNNLYGEIGEVTVTVQTVSQSYISATFNVPFLIPGSIGTSDGIGDAQLNNRHLHVTVWDDNGGMSNYKFNDGVYVDDIYAYPQVETSYEKPLEVEKLCLNENPNKRYTCAFDMVKQWTIKNAEVKLKEIYNENNYKTDSEIK